MTATSKLYFLLTEYNPSLKAVIISTMVGGVLQIICINYLQNGSEIPDDLKSPKISDQLKPKKKMKRWRRFLPRGGALISITGAKVVLNIKPVIYYLAKKGTITGLLAPFGYKVVTNIPSKALSKYLYQSLPSSHANYGKKGYLIAEINTDEILDTNMRYLLKILSDKDISVDHKITQAKLMIKNHTNLTTREGKIGFVLVMVSLLSILYLTNTAGFFALLQSLIEAIKDGRVSKRLSRIIIRRLKNLGIDFDPELISNAS